MLINHNHFKNIKFIDNNIDNNNIINDNEDKNMINDYYNGLPKDFNQIERPQTAVIN